MGKTFSVGCSRVNRAMVFNTSFSKCKTFTTRGTLGSFVLLQHRGRLCQKYLVSSKPSDRHKKGSLVFARENQHGHAD